MAKILEVFHGWGMHFFRSSEFLLMHRFSKLMFSCSSTFLDAILILKSKWVTFSRNRCLCSSQLKILNKLFYEISNGRSPLITKLAVSMDRFCCCHTVSLKLSKISKAEHSLQARRFVIVTVLWKINYFDCIRLFYTCMDNATFVVASQ